MNLTISVAENIGNNDIIKNLTLNDWNNILSTVIYLIENNQPYDNNLIDQLKKQLKDTETDLQNRIDDINKQKIHDINKAIEENTSYLTNSLTQLKAAHDHLTKEYYDLQGSIIKHKQEADQNMKATYEKQLKETIDHYKMIYTEMINDIKNKNDNNTTQLQSAYDHLTKEYSALQGSIIKLQLETEQNTKAACNKQHEENISYLTNSLTQLRASYDQLQQDYSTIRGDTTKYKIEMEASLRETYDTQLKDTIQKIKTQYEENLTQLRESYDQLQQDYSNLQRNFNKSQQESESFLKETYDKQLKDTIQEMKTQHDHNIKQIKLSYDQLQQDYSALQGSIMSYKQEAEQSAKAVYDKHTEQLITSYQSKLDNHNSMIQSLKDQIQILKDNNETIEKINQTLEPVVKFYGGTNEEKGSSGENMIYNILVNDLRYTSATIVNMSNETATGDIHLTWQNMKCLIEVKNKGVITKDDISKFERDIINNINNGINCGLFVSLRCNKFPNRSNETIQIEIIDKTPAIYVYLKNINDIHLVLLTLDLIVKSSVTSSDTLHKFKLHFNNYYILINDLIEVVNKDIKTKEKELKTLEDRRKQYMKQLTIIEKDKILMIDETEEVIINSDNDPSTAAPSDAAPNVITNDEKTNIINDLYSLYKKNTTNTKTQPFTYQLIQSEYPKYTDGVLNQLGGITVILNECKKSFIKKTLTKTVMEKIRKAENQTTRQGIVSTLGYNKISALNKAFNTKKIVDIVRLQLLPEYLRKYYNQEISNDLSAEIDVQDLPNSVLDIYKLVV